MIVVTMKGVTVNDMAERIIATFVPVVTALRVWKSCISVSRLFKEHCGNSQEEILGTFMEAHVYIGRKYNKSTLRGNVLSA